ncbi:MAG: 5-(carboxyamino)imidazole ribonucleotide mutase [bacterium]|nr:5-(carboxyamino)imidazole ribonucleotide mutase [bacterium]
MSRVVIIMGSKSDLKWSEEIAEALKKLGVESILRIASAHKVPLKCFEIIKKYEDENVVFITVAGRSNALSGFTDAQTHCPVIACPPYSEKFGGADIWSTLRTPSAVAPMVVLEPENAALAAAKILGLQDRIVREKIKQYQAKSRETIEKDDKEIQKR